MVNTRFELFTLQSSLELMIICLFLIFFFNVGSAAAYRPTPATIRVVTPLLGDYCNEDKDCSISNSVCINGNCICSDGFAETSDRQDCSSLGKKLISRNTY